MAKKIAKKAGESKPPAVESVAITQAQAETGGALQELGFELQKSKKKGGPQTYEITDETVSTLGELVGEKVLVVGSSGTVSLEDA